MKFIFIAVNYNGSNYTIEYIKSINSMHNLYNDNIRIIIVDNNSKYEDISKIERYCANQKNILLIKNDFNLGYFKGLNKGIEKAIVDGDTFLIIGNNDLIFDNNFVANLRHIIYDNSVLVIAPNVITKDGRKQNPHVINRVSLIEKLKCKIYFSNYYVGQAFRIVNQTIKHLVKKQNVKNNSYEQMIIKRGIGACYILTPNFNRYFEKLDDRVFMWGEEALLSNQIESVGGKTLYDPSIIVYHHESASVNMISSKERYYIVKKSYQIYKDYL